MPAHTRAWTPLRRRRRWAVAGWVVLLAGLLAAAWLAPGGAADAQTGADVVGDSVAGEQVYAANCAMCHGPDATGMADVPSLHGVVARLGVDGVEATVRDGRQTNPPMPAFGDRLEDADVDDVIAYLAELDEAPADGAPPDAEPPDAEPRPREPHPGMWERMRGGPTMDGWWWAPAGLWALVIGLLVLAAVVVLVVVLVRAASSRPSPPPPHRDETPREILDARYARGEIDRDAYLQARRDRRGGMDDCQSEGSSRSRRAWR